MNDTRFIELLNLYVDQELTDEEARALEQEIARRPERRQIYTQYCQMQRACVRLFEQQKAPAPSVESLRAAALAHDEPAAPVEVFRLPVDPMPARRRLSWGRAAWSGGLMAAAACVTFLVVRQTGVPTGADPVAGGTTVAEVAAEASPALAAAPTAEPAAPQYRPVLVVNALLRPNAEATSAAPAAASFDPSALTWLQEVKLTRIPPAAIESLHFDAGGMRSLDHRGLALDNRNEPVATEISAFQFQR